MAESSTGFRRARFASVPSWRRWWPLARNEFEGLFQSRWGVALYCLCLLPAVGRLILLLIVFGVIRMAPSGSRGPLGGRRGELALNPAHVEFYFDHVLQPLPGMVFLLLFATLVVARAVAKDRTTNALELYWTRSISPLAYVFAKWVGTTLLLATMTVLAPCLLWGTAVLLAEDWGLLQETWFAMARATVGLVGITAVWTAIGIAISAAAASPNGAMVWFASLLVGTRAVGAVVARFANEPSMVTCLSLWDAGGALARAMAGVPQRDVSIVGAAGLLSVVLTVLLWRARGRLRTHEVIA